MHSHKLKIGITFFAILIIITACSNEKLIKPGDSLRVAYQKSVTLFQDGHYRDASNAFKKVINYGRGTDYAKNSQYFLGQSYFKSSQYLLAANAYQQFTILYPQSPQTEIATYKEGMCYFKLSPRYATDQKYTQQAIQQFNLFISEYPNSDLLDKAGKYVTKLRSKLAHKIFNAAQLYFKLDQFKAAVIYYDATVDQYPGTSWAERSLVREIAVYNKYASKSVRSSKVKRYKKAVAAYQQYLQLFPNGKHKTKAKANAQTAQKALAGLQPDVSNQTASSSH
jgi:outer membrane protein assembly factor BamD